METSDAWDKWFPRARLLTFLVIGMGIIVYETLHDGRLEVMLIGCGVAGLEIPLAVSRRIGSERS